MPFGDFRKTIDSSDDAALISTLPDYPLLSTSFARFDEAEILGCGLYLVLLYP